MKSKTSWIHTFKTITKNTINDVHDTSLHYLVSFTCFLTISFPAPQQWWRGNCRQNGENFTTFPKPALQFADDRYFPSIWLHVTVFFFCAPPLTAAARDGERKLHSYFGYMFLVPRDARQAWRRNRRLEGRWGLYIAPLVVSLGAEGDNRKCYVTARWGDMIQMRRISSEWICLLVDGGRLSFGGGGGGGGGVSVFYTWTVPRRFYKWFMSLSLSLSCGDLILLILSLSLSLLHLAMLRSRIPLPPPWTPAVSSDWSSNKPKNGFPLRDILRGTQRLASTLPANPVLAWKRKPKERQMKTLEIERVRMLFFFCFFCVCVCTIANKLSQVFKDISSTHDIMGLEKFTASLKLISRSTPKVRHTSITIRLW